MKAWGLNYQPPARTKQNSICRNQRLTTPQSDCKHRFSSFVREQSRVNKPKTSLCLDITRDREHQLRLCTPSLLQPLESEAGGSPLLLAASPVQQLCEPGAYSHPASIHKVPVSYAKRVNISACHLPTIRSPIQDNSLRLLCQRPNGMNTPFRVRKHL